MRCVWMKGSIDPCITQAGRHAPVRGLGGLLGEEVEEGPERVRERLGVLLRRLVPQQDACRGVFGGVAGA